MPTDPDDVYATCTAAAEVIERQGLYRDGFWPGGDYTAGVPVCLYGAIAVATGLTSVDVDDDGVDLVMEDSTCPASLAVLTEIQARHGPMSIPLYSDEIAESAAEVIGLLRDVAAKHRPDEYRSAPGGGGS
jgi:hypothetical protein